MNRKDLHVAVSTDGTMYVAQGAPALKKLEERDDISDQEGPLFHSQLAHRGVKCDGGHWRICLHSVSPYDKSFDLAGRKATGTPVSFCSPQR